VYKDGKWNLMQTTASTAPEFFSVNYSNSDGGSDGLFDLVAASG